MSATGELIVFGNSLTIDGVEFSLVPASESHRSFIIATWVRSGEQIYKKQTAGVGDWSTPLRRSSYMAHEPAIAEAMWSAAVVMIDPGSPDTVHAWVCGEHGKLMHGYVPPELRRMRIFSTMAAYVCGAGKVSMMRPWPHGRPPHGWSYDPYMSGEYYARSIGKI